MRRAIVGVLVLAFVGVACGGDVTQSDEYLELAAERDRLEQSLDDRLSALQQLGTDLGAAAAEATSQQQRADELEDALADAQQKADELQAELERAANAQPWPPGLVDGFVEGCVGGATEGGGDPDEAANLCQCVVEELQDTITLNDFVVFSLATADPTVELDSSTGFPISADPVVVGAVTSAAIGCVAAS